MKTERKQCLVVGCKNAYLSAGYCQAHYRQVNRHGKVTSEKTIVRERYGKRNAQGWLQATTFLESLGQKFTDQGSDSLGEDFSRTARTLLVEAKRRGYVK